MDLRDHPLIGIAVIISTVVAVAMIGVGNDVGKAGYVLLGATIALTSSLISESLKRSRQAKDLAHALYIELSDRAARCCFDSEWPWNGYLDLEACKKTEMGAFRLRKFAPINPTVYPATAGQLGLLREGVAPALTHFYYRLAAWGRDVENMASENLGRNLDAKDIRFLAMRLQQTLAPGLRALEALSVMVERPELIDAPAITAHDEMQRRAPPQSSLRERLRTLIDGPLSEVKANA